MGRRHLYELLNEEQEPFTLHSFIEERRRQLRRPFSKALSAPALPPPPSSTPLHQLHLQPKRHAPPASVSARSCRSSTSTFMHLWDSSKTRTSPLSSLSYTKNPSSAPKLPAAFLLETALRIQKLQHQQQNQKKRWRRASADGNPSKDLRLGFLVSAMKKLLGRKRRHLEIASPQGEARFAAVSVKGFSRRESAHGWETGQRTIGRARLKSRDTDPGVGKPPHHRARSVLDKGNDGEGRVSQGLVTCRSDVLESYPSKDSVRPPPQSSERASVSSPSRQHPLGLSSSLGPSPEPSPAPAPASSCRHPSVERQLFGGNGDEGRAKPPYYEGEKEQFSPVSVLDPRFDEEEDDDDGHNSHDRHHLHERAEEHQAGGEEGEEAVDVDGETTASSFRQSLAAVQRAKQELLGTIRRFERLADLDSVELDGLFAEVEDQGAACDVSEEMEQEQAGTQDALDVHESELLQVVLDAVGHDAKVLRDMKRLVADLAGEESGGDEPAGWSPTTAAERVRSRLEAKGVGSGTTIEMMVGMDVRREGETWRRWPEEVCAVAAEVEAAVFALLMYEIADDLSGCTC